MGKLNTDSASSLDKVEYLVDLFGGLSIVARGLVASRSSPGNNLLCGLKTGRRIHHATTTSLEGDGNNMIQETDKVEEVP